MSNIALNPAKPTWKSNETIEFEVTYENSRDCNFINIIVHRVFELNDLAIGQYMLPLSKIGNNKYKVTLQIPNIGLFYISKVIGEQYPKSKLNPSKYDMQYPLLFDPFEENEFFSPYFLVTDDNSNYSTKAIKNYANSIYEKRFASLKLGNENDGNLAYEVIVLCKDVYLSSEAQFNSCVVKPYIPTTHDELLMRINKYMETKKWQKFSLKEDRKDILYSPNPQIIFEFPKVFASNHDKVVD
jgi:hypothetical protein